VAGSVTTTVTQAGAGVVKTSIAWTSDAAGAVSGTAVTLPAGTIVGVEFIPSASVAPSNLYDVTMTDAGGANILDDGAGASVGLNLSDTTAAWKQPMVGGGAVTYVRRWIPAGDYTPVVANAGNAKQGTIVIYQAPGVL
jgi:hypothetical protein